MEIISRTNKLNISSEETTGLRRTTSINNTEYIIPINIGNGFECADDSPLYTNDFIQQTRRLSIIKIDSTDK